VVDGTPAHFLVDLPVAYDTKRAYPLVLAFHDRTQTAEQFRTDSKLQTVAASDGIVVYPDPLDPTASWEFQRDILLVDALLSKLGASYCVDQDRTFALGEGSGALFVNLVGCVLADRVRAFAALSGAPPPPGPCIGNTAVWLLQRGDADAMTVGAGLGNRDFWATRNLCDLSRSAPVSPAPCVEYRSCMDGLPVHYCGYTGDLYLEFGVRGAWDFFQSL
jgi:polyhydroxybutyrate depolymerase